MAQVETRNRATSSEAARKDVLKRVEGEGVDIVLLWFTDLEGHLKSFAITPQELEGALDDGMGFDGSSITGFNAIEESDMVAIPDPGTFQLMPARRARRRSARMICDVVTPDGKPYEGDPRYVLRRALERMSAMGFDTFNVGPELEYFLFKDSTRDRDARRGRLLRDDDAGRGDRAPQRHDPRRSSRWASRSSTTITRSARRSTRSTCASRPALDMADYMITYRLIVKEIAAKNGVYATFMPKPIFGENGSGMHTHQSLFKDGRNAFFDGDDEWHLSDDRQGVHRRPAPPRARDLGGVRAVGELLQAARAGLRGAGLRRVVAAQPLGADPDPALQAGLRAGDARRDPLSRPGVQPVPDLRSPAPRRPRGDRAGLRAARPDGDEPLPPHAGAAARAGNRLAAGDARRGDRRAGRSPSWCARRSARTSSTATWS